MLQVIKNNTPFTVIILFIFTILVKMQALINPQLPIVAEGSFVFGSVVAVLNFVLFNNAFAYTFLGVVMLFGQAIFLNAIANKYKLYQKQTYVVAYLFICLSSLYPAFNYFSEVLLANWFYIAAINIILSIHESNRPRKAIFDIGFLLSTAAIIHFPGIVMILLLFLSISFMRRFNLREWLVGALGSLIPIYFLLMILYLVDGLQLMPSWFHLGLSLPRNIPDPTYNIGLVVGIIILVSMGVYALQAQMTRAGLFVRRGWTVFAFMFIFSIVIATFTDFQIKSGWLITVPVLSLIVAPAFYAEKNKVFRNFAFYFSLLLVVFCQFTANY